MRRADRLFLLINTLQGRRVALPARSLAEKLGVSLRTVYRDVGDLQLSGVPIEGAAGVGYLLRQGADIPPLMFTADELESLVVGSRFVRTFGGERLAKAARSARLKIEAVLPPTLKDRSRRTRIYAPDSANRIEATGVIERLHEAVSRRRVLRLSYRDRGGAATNRDVEPLCLSFWGGSWTLGAWCRLRVDFRSFRPDRMESVQETTEVFAEAPERGLEAYLRTLGTTSDD